MHFMHGRRNRGDGGMGGHVSPPILETGAFVPPTNYTARRKILDFILNTACCHRPLMVLCAPMKPSDRAGLSRSPPNAVTERGLITALTDLH